LIPNLPLFNLRFNKDGNFCDFKTRKTELENDQFASITDGPQPLGDFFTIDLSGGYTTKEKVTVKVYFRM